MEQNWKGHVVNFQATLSKAGLKAAILTSRGSLLYFGGVWTPWRSALIIEQTGDPTLITCRIDAGRIRERTWVKDIVSWDFAHESNFCHQIISTLKDRGINTGSVGAEIAVLHTPGVLSAREYLDLKEAFPKINIENVLDKVYELMLVKEGYEIELLRRAAEIADVGMQVGFEALRPGITELSLLGIMENAMFNAGSMYTWAPAGNEVASGYRQRYPECLTVMPSNKIIQYGDLVTFDLHPMVDGYLGDLALNAVAGPLTDPVRRLADEWEQIVGVLMDALKPGRSLHDVACTVESAVQKRKLDAYIFPLYGHGLGTDARMPPVIVKGDQRILKPRIIVEAVLQINDPSIGGLRVETPVLITETGNELLCKTPVKLHVSN